MAKLPLLDFYCHGVISQDKRQEIRNALEECYLRLGQRLPERVEVHLFETQVQLGAFLETEKAELGIQTTGDEAFICSHDAWRDFPRLLICVERLFSLATLARLGTIRHEAAHTVLHGALVYYIFQIPPDCIELAQAKGMDLNLMQQVLYFCATAVKDFEVTRLLLRKGYRGCQLALAKAQFLPSDEDKLAWSLTQCHAQGVLIFFAAQLKTLLLGLALATAGLMQLEESTDSMLNYIESEERRRLLGLVASIGGELGDDTHDNVRLVLQKVLRELL